MNILEQSIWIKIQTGDLQSFEILFNTYYKGLLLYAQDLLRNRQDAEENVLDIFHTLWEKKDTIVIHTSVKSYLLRSIHNRCIDFLRRKKSVQNKKHGYLYEMNDQPVSTIDVKEEFTLEHLYATELEQDIDKVINSLPHQCREVFCLSRFEQLRIREIAEKLNISESTVKTQISRALNKLRQHLKDHLA